MAAGLEAGRFELPISCIRIPSEGETFRRRRRQHGRTHHEAALYRRDGGCRGGNFCPHLGTARSVRGPASGGECARRGAGAGAIDEPDAGWREGNLGEGRYGFRHARPSPTPCGAIGPEPVQRQHRGSAQPARTLSTAGRSSTGRQSDHNQSDARWRQGYIGGTRALGGPAERRPNCAGGEAAVDRKPVAGRCRAC